MPDPKKSANIAKAHKQFKLKNEREEALVKKDIIPNFQPKIDKPLSSKQIEQLRLQKLKEKQGEIRASTPQSVASKIKEVSLNPLTAFGYAARSESLPDNFSRGERNILDNVVDIVNPAFYLNQGIKAQQNISNSAGNVARGNLPAAYRDIKNAGVNAVAALPLAAEYKTIGKGIGQAGKFVGTEEGLLSNAYKYNPRAFKPKQDAYYRQVFGENIDPLVTKSMKLNKDPKGVNAFLEGQDDVIFNNNGEKMIDVYNLKTKESLPYFNKNKPFYPRSKPGVNETLLETKNNLKDYSDFYPSKIKSMSLNPEQSEAAGKMFGEIRTLSPFSETGHNIDNYNVYKKHWLQGYKKVSNNVQHADGGQIHNNLNIKYNNYLNNNMKQYAQGGKLTRFDEGGTHEQNPLGGIPQGQDGQGNMNTVEQGETKKGNFVYSDRITLNKDLIKQFNLPGYVSNKSVSAASKAIDDQFKDRQDKYAQETKKTLLERLSQAQEHLKAQEQAQQEQINQSMQANSQQVPDMMEGQIPEGMEEYAEQGQQQNPQEEMMEVQNQMYLGGSFGIAEAGNMTAGGKGIGANTPLSKVYAGQQQYMMGGRMNKYYDGGGLTPAGLVSTPMVMPTTPIADPNRLGAAANTAGAAGGAGSIPGGVAGALGMASGVMGLANLSQGNGASTNKGMSALSGAMQGAAGGAALGPIGAGVGALVGVGAGLLGSAAADRAETRQNDTAAATYNNQFTDKYAFGGTLKPGVKPSVGNSTLRPSVEMKNNTVNMMAQGGGLTSKDRGSDNKPYPSVDSSDFAGGGRSYPIPTKTDAVDALRLAGLHGRSDVRSKVFAKYPSLKHANGGELTKDMFGDDSNLYVNRYAVGGPINPPLGFAEGFGADSKGYSSDMYSRPTPFPKPLHASADYNTNIIQNFQDDFNMDPKTPGYGKVWGPKSKKLYSAGIVGGTAPTQKELLASPFDWSTNTMSSKGMTKEGYVFNPQQPDMSGLVKKDAPFVEPAGVLAGMKQNYQVNKAKENVSSDKENWFDRNSGKFGEAMRYAPVAMNAYQLSQLKKPQATQYNTLQDKFRPQYVDEAQLQNIAGQTQRNQINALSQSGASPAQMRAAILGSGVNMNRGLSEAYANAANENRATNERGQAFDASINAQNVGIKNRAIDEYRADQGNYDTQKSKYLSAIGTDIGSIGKEEVNKDQIASMLGYTWRGKYMVDKSGKRVTPQQISDAKRQVAESNDKPVYNATTGEKINYGSYGGFLKTNKRGY